MQQNTHLAMALSLTLVIALHAQPAISDLPAAHESIRDRHHLRYGTVIPDPTDAPHGIPGELSACLSCHEVDTSSGSIRILIETDCRACHGRDRHHPLYNTTILDSTDAPYRASDGLYGCLTCHTLDTSSGVNEFLVERDCGACHQTLGTITVAMDIRPGNRRNRVNLRSKGLLPISILGSSEYDVAEIDVSSLRLAGEVAPSRWRLKQRAGGQRDLKLKFSSEALLDALGDLQPGETYEVWVTGRLHDGTRILGSDFILAVGRPARKLSSVSTESIPSSGSGES